MHTYASVILNSEGAPASEVTTAFKDLGFTTTLGTYDFSFDWGSRDVTPEQVISFVEKVQGALKGKKVLITISTIP